MIVQMNRAQRLFSHSFIGALKNLNEDNATTAHYVRKAFKIEGLSGIAEVRVDEAETIPIELSEGEYQWFKARLRECTEYTGSHGDVLVPLKAAMLKAEEEAKMRANGEARASA
jgi:hypothetical protein